MTAAALLVALALHARAPDRDAGAPEPRPSTAAARTPDGGAPDAGAPDPDAEVIEHLDELERLELLQNLELFEAEPEEER